MDYVYAVISLLAGLGCFLLGFKILSENIEKLANNSLKKLFNKTSNRRLVGVGIGAGVTAIIQSSSATTVMIVGLVNANVIDLFQATYLIMGANIGTTITAQIVALQSFDLANIAMIFAFIGMFIHMLSKKDKTKTIGMALTGLGIVFLALKFMSTSMNVVKESTFFIEMLQSINNPVLLLLCGIILTAIIQSSSAVTTILISMVSVGLVIGNGGNSILYVILGSNIGTCITALLSSIGANTNAKRASIIHLLFNLFGAILFFVILLIFPSFNDKTFAHWFAFPTTQIAMFHTFFNVISTLVFLPFAPLFVKISSWLIKDKEKVQNVSFIDERFLNTPSVAMTQVIKETIRLGSLSMDALNLSIDGFIHKDLLIQDEVNAKIKEIDKINENIINYLIKISSVDISTEDEKMISTLHHMLNDFYREAEIADNMLKYTKETIQNHLVFSNNVYESITRLKEMLNEQFHNVKELVFTRNYILIKRIEELEESIDEFRKILINSHIKRLEEGICSPTSSGVFINLISNLERAGDHLNYIAHSIIEN